MRETEARNFRGPCRLSSWPFEIRNPISNNKSARLSASGDYSSASELRALDNSRTARKHLPSGICGRIGTPEGKNEYKRVEFSNGRSTISASFRGRIIDPRVPGMLGRRDSAFGESGRDSRTGGVYVKGKKESRGGRDGRRTGETERGKKERRPDSRRDRILT